MKKSGTNDSLLVTDLKVIDPCMGSGHILVYAFDVLMQIYTDAGWSEREAAKAIVENNLYGIDIDDRATQLAYFAVMMKARHYSRRILNGETKPNLISVTDSNQMTDEFISFAAGNDNELKGDLITLRKTFTDAKDYGSIISVPKLNFHKLYERIDDICNNLAENMFTSRFKAMTAELLLPLVKQAQIMAQKYDVVVTNPPYMGASNMSAKLSEFVKKNFPDSKSDLFACFIEHCGEMAKKNGYQAMITQHAWMFLSSYEKLREKLLNKTIINMAHLGARAFEEIGGEVVQTTSFVMQNSRIPEYKGTYCRLVEPTTQQGKEELFLSTDHCPLFTCSQGNFSKIPGSPVAYWVSERVIKSFKWKNIGNYLTTREGMATANNDLFLRLWYELPICHISFKTKFGEILKTKKCWVPYNKGGDFRKWYGNNDYVVNWQDDGYLIRNNIDPKTGRIRSHNYNGEYSFQRGITWSAISSSKISVRYCPEGYLFDSKGAKGFSDQLSKLEQCLAIINSCVGLSYLSFLPPTIDFKVGDIIQIPFFVPNNKDVDNVTENCISLSRTDWDSYETSWDFKRNPMV